MGICSDDGLARGHGIRRSEMVLLRSQRVLAVGKPPCPAALGRAELGVAALPAIAPPDGRSNTTDW